MGGYGFAPGPYERYIELFVEFKQIGRAHV